MTDAVIRLDRLRAFSECRGERQTDDPHYRVHFWQGQMVGRDMILLPFDAQGDLVPDDGKTEPYPGKDTDGKPTMHYPLYNQPMRDLLDKKRKRQTVATAKGEDSDDENIVTVSEEVNFVSWLRGEARYEWTILQTAARTRFHHVYTKKGEMVADLVLDEHLIPEDQLAPDLAKLLPARAAA